jgi:hypothetical protein
MSESNLKKLSGLWMKDGKKGKFMTGSLNSEAMDWIENNGPCKLLVFKNDRKEDDKHPDYHLFAAPQEDNGGGNRQKQQAEAEDFF